MVPLPIRVGPETGSIGPFFVEEEPIRVAVSLARGAQPGPTGGAIRRI
jgi:hypothetical protein